MKTRYEFAVVLDGVSAVDDRLENRVFEAGCDDALLAQRSGVVFLEFSREETSFEAAVISALRDLSVCEPGVHISHVEPDDYVTAAEIARRLDCSREYVRLLVSGARGDGGFPAPRSGVTMTSPLWSWTTVLGWLEQRGMLDDPALLADAETVRDINRSLERSRHGTRPARERELKAALALSGK